MALRCTSIIIAIAGHDVALASEAPIPRIRPAGLGVTTATAPSEPVGRIQVELDGVPVSSVIEILLSDVLRSSYVMTPEAYADGRVVSVKIDATIPEARKQATAYLAALGYDLDDTAGMDTIRTALPKAIDETPFIYSPRHRGADYLSMQLAPLVSGRMTADANGSIVFYGSAADVKRLEDALPRIDRPSAEIEVQAAVYEVTSQGRDGSAIELATGLLQQGIGLNIDLGIASPVATPTAAASGQGGGSQGITIRTADLTFIANVLSTDSRFRLITKPTVRAQSGSATRFTSGDTVPVLGNVSYSEAGTPIQSIDYRDSGVVFEVTPIIHDAQIDLKVSQELSSFSETTTGVNGTPTLNKRALQSTLSMQDGETVILGGLIQHNEGTTRRSIFGFPLGDQASGSTTEVIIVMTTRMEGSTRYQDPLRTDVFNQAIPTDIDPDLAAALAAIQGDYAPPAGSPLRYEKTTPPIIEEKPINPRDLPPGQRPYLADRLGACGIAGLWSKC